MATHNGTWKWLFGLLFAVTTGIGAYAFMSVDSRVTKLEDANLPRVERLATVEAEIKRLRQDLQRIEAKIDDLKREATRSGQTSR
jgi:cell division protein FtsB